MTDKTFKRIIDQLALQPFKLKELQYHGNGEPLLTKKFFSFVRYARDKDVAIKHRLTTNGTTLTPNNLKKVVDAGINEIHVSLDVVDRNKYTELKGGDHYNKVELNLDYAIKFLTEHKTCQLFIKYAIPHIDGNYGFTNAEADDVVAQYRSRVENSSFIHLKGMPVVSLAGGKSEKKRTYHTPCEIPFYSLFIKFDGKVSVCCADLFDDLTIGDINKSELHDILDSEPLRKIRRYHLENKLEKLPICLYCGNRTSVDMTKIAESLMEYI